MTLPKIPANSDPNNRTKAVFDLLVSLKLVEGDSVKHNSDHTVTVAPENKGFAIVRVDEVA